MNLEARSAETVLDSFKPSQPYLVCVDSDGCVFDTMGIKQRECFCPWMISCFGLQPVALAARECKEHADLFSKTRGANRHITMNRILTELLPGHPMVRRRGFTIPSFAHYSDWVDDPNSVLSDDGLRWAIERCGDGDKEKGAQLAKVLEWSSQVNWAIAHIVRNIPPFLRVRQTLTRLAKRADVVVVSATPLEALQREWSEHKLDEVVALICGQEMGTKQQQIGALSVHYRHDQILMIGDAPGDLQAARANKTLFWPVIPAHEDSSWEQLHSDGVELFFSGLYAGAYEDARIREFDLALPERPSWEEVQ